MISATLDAALATAMASINGTAPFTVTLATFSHSPIEVEKLKCPAVVVYESAFDEEDGGSVDGGVSFAVQRWGVGLFVRSSDPHAAVRVLQDNVRIAAGSISYALLSSPNVITTKVTASDEVKTTTDMQGTLGETRCSIEARCHFNRSTAA